MQHTTSKATQALEGRVFREWLKLSPERRTGIALRDFEDDLWGRSMRLGKSPFLHHQGVMRVIGRPLDPTSVDSTAADLGLAAADVDTWRELWRRYMKNASQSGVFSLKAPRMRGLSGSPEWRSSSISASSRPSRPK